MRIYNAPIMARPPKGQPTDFGIRLAQARTAAGLTQAQLAKRMGTSQQVIGYFERRAQNPTTDSIRKMANVLNVPVNDLLESSGEGFRKLGPSSQFEQRILAVRKLPREKQRMVLQFLDSFLRDTQVVSAKG